MMCWARTQAMADLQPAAGPSPGLLWYALMTITSTGPKQSWLPPATRQ